MLSGLTINDNIRPLTFRREKPDDEAFLYAIYASTREDELALTNWDASMRRAFLDQQFGAMCAGYRSMFPEAEFLIIEADGQSIGRMVLDESKEEIRVVDLALTPAERNRGVGTLLMQCVCAGAKKPVRLCVLKQNRALRWYARLGFKRIGESGFHDELEWRPCA